VVVNQQRLAAILGKDATPEQVSARIAEIQKVVASAAGLNEQRGDVINVSAVEFIDGLDGVEVPEPGFFDSVSVQAGTLINALAFVIVAFLVAWFGLKPMVASITKSSTPELPMPSFEDMQASLPLPDPVMAAITGGNPMGFGNDGLPDAAMGMGMGMGMGADSSLDDIRSKIKPAPQDRLARMVELNEERSAQILRKWTAAEAA
jgi:flagellar M-ring protein FliF